MSPGVYNAHLVQTAHSERTAREKYLIKNSTREERSPVLQNYPERLMTVREDGNCLVDDPSPVSADELLKLDFEEEPPRHTHEGVNTRRVDTVTRFNLLKARFVTEFREEPGFIFASKVNKVESSVSRSLQEIVKKQFEDDPQKVRYNANSASKFWERLSTVLRCSVSPGVYNAHLVQTAHSERTAREKYLIKNSTREERSSVLQNYLERPMTVREDGNCLVDDTSPVSADELFESDFEEEPPRHTHEGVNTGRV